MTVPDLTMDVRHPVSGVAVVDIAGEVTAACEPALMQAYDKASVPGTHVLVLNFSGLEYMNRRGSGRLVTLLVRANRQQQRLAAYGLTDHYRQIFELTRLDEAITIHEDERSALAAV